MIVEKITRIGKKILSQRQWILQLRGGVLPVAAFVCVLIYWLEGESWERYRETLDAQAVSGRVNTSLDHSAKVLVRVHAKKGYQAYKDGSLYALVEPVNHQATLKNPVSLSQDSPIQFCVLTPVRVYLMHKKVFLAFSHISDVYSHKMTLEKSVYLLDMDEVYDYPSCPAKRVVYGSL